MNAAEVCHEVDGCSGLYVDAFRGRCLRRMQDPDNTFILTHYHGDHYQNLPRDRKYTGPAQIHCTPVTAALLIQVHKVDARWVVEHDYEQTFFYAIKGRGNEQARITFYDANHCPGACIVLIQLPDGTTHLHTGDMRYHERFKSYPLLREAVSNNKLDIVYLDTTYSHPKHDFVPQDEAVQAIADTTVELLGSGPPEDDDMQSRPKTLILLSCYSIGKEKVLWEAATRTNQLVYVTEKKLKMLHCVQGHESQEVSSQIVHRCTRDENATPIHVIPMGLAGEIWPFFRPNFLKCADYARCLQQKYDKVVAFLPTGWAHGSKWNREHAVSQKTIPANDTHGPIDIEVRLIPYSEHSAFTELVSFVQYLRPRKVIPTVFSDEADYRKIEQRFHNLLDTKRAKQAFFRSMEKRPPVDSPDLSVVTASCVAGGCNGADETSKVMYSSVLQAKSADLCVGDESDNDEVEVLRVEPPIQHRSDSSIPVPIESEHLATLTAMGFPLARAQLALDASGGDVDRAVDKLLSSTQSLMSSSSPPSRKMGDSPSSTIASNTEDSSPASTSKRKRKAAPSTSRAAPPITNFFARKTAF